MLTRAWAPDSSAILARSCRSDRFRWATVDRFWSPRAVSVSRVSSTWQPWFSSSSARARAIERFSSFSDSPEAPVAPPSSPPWPGSIRIKGLFWK